MAPAPAGVAFACPGGCGKTCPLEEGHLVIEQPPSTGDRRVAVNRRRGPALAVILCAPCTAALVIERGRPKERTT